MGRKSEPLYQEPITKIWYARYYKAGKRILLSLETIDQAEAIQRHPICVNAHMGWREYRETMSGWQNNAKMIVSKVATATSLVTIDPPQSLPTDTEAFKALLDAAASRGMAKYDAKTGIWRISAQGDGDVQTQLLLIKDILGKPTASFTDQSTEIETFYNAAVPQLYTDKNVAARHAKIWLRFLRERKIVSWEQINDTLLQDFRLWRLKTPIATEKHPERAARAPGERVVTRHLQFLKNSFALAVKRGIIKFNPLDLVVFPKCKTPKQQYLTLAELITLIRDAAWDQNHLTRGATEFPLPYTFRDILLLLVVACKRRKEICYLRIEDFYWDDNAAGYKEWKNESKEEDSPMKAFWLTPQLKVFIKRIAGNRTSGYLFLSPWGAEEPINPDLISSTFDVVVKQVAPKKKVTLKNLRQTIYAICEDGGMPIPEIDILLGHYSVKTALPYYQDMSPRLQAKRIAPMTRKGVELLCEVLKEFIK